MEHKMKKIFAVSLHALVCGSFINLTLTILNKRDLINVNRGLLIASSLIVLGLCVFYLFNIITNSRLFYGTKEE